jgi:hypothetical protein
MSASRGLSYVLRRARWAERTRLLVGQTVPTFFWKELYFWFLGYLTDLQQSGRLRSVDCTAASFLRHVVACHSPREFGYSSRRDHVGFVFERGRGRYSSVGIGTCCGLDGPVMESRWGEILYTSADWPWGPPCLLYNGYRVSFPGVKRPGCNVNHPPTSSTEVRERVELYFYFHSGSSWLVIGRNLPLLCIPLLSRKCQWDRFC